MIVWYRLVDKLVKAGLLHSTTDDQSELLIAAFTYTDGSVLKLPSMPPMFDCELFCYVRIGGVFH